MRLRWLLHGQAARLDNSARLTPLTSADADKLLLGYRDLPAGDLAGLRDLLQRVSRLAEDLPQIANLDLDSVIVDPDGVHVTGVRIKVAPHEPHDPFLRKLR